MRKSFAIMALAAAVPSLALAQQPASPATVDQTLAPYASTAQSVRLPDGRTVHLVCMGQGSPTVLLAAGGLEWSIFWNTVQPAVAAKTRVCAWDRASLGLSSPSPRAPTADNTVADLEAALRAGGITGPYVIAGHSLGGYDSLLFADRNRAQVVGMVLIDPTPVSDPAAPPDVDIPAIMAVMQGDPPFVAHLQRCAAGLRDGTLRAGGSDPNGCLARQAPPANYPSVLAEAVEGAFDAVAANPETMALALDNYGFYLSAKMLEQNARLAFKPDRNYGDLPLIVLSAGQDGASSRDTPEIRAELPLLLASKHRNHAKLAALSSRGVHRVVADSDHNIPRRAPQAVIDAILEVVAQARTETQ